MDRLWVAPLRVTIRVPDMNPETDRQQVDSTTGERLWVREDVNAVMYYGSVALMIPYLLVWVVTHEVRLSFSETYRTEYFDRIEKRRGRQRRSTEN